MTPSPAVPPARDVAEVAREVLAAHQPEGRTWCPQCRGIVASSCEPLLLARFVLALVEPDDATVERVARALQAHAVRDFGRSFGWVTCDEPARNRWLAQARVALAALTSEPQT